MQNETVVVVGRIRTYAGRPQWISSPSPFFFLSKKAQKELFLFTHKKINILTEFNSQITANVTF